MYVCIYVSIYYKSTFSQRDPIIQNKKKRAADVSARVAAARTLSM